MKKMKTSNMLKMIFIATFVFLLMATAITAIPLQKLTISSVRSDKSIYTVGEKAVIYAKVLDNDGTAATPREGTTVYFTLTDLSTGDSVRGIFKMEYDFETSYYSSSLNVPGKGRWQVNLTAARDVLIVSDNSLILKVAEASHEELLTSSAWSDKPSYKIGETPIIYAKVLDRDGSIATPEEKTIVSYTLTNLDTGETITEKCSGEVKCISWMQFDNTTGYYNANLYRLSAAKWQVKITAIKYNLAETTSEVIFEVYETSEPIRITAVWSDKPTYNIGETAIIYSKVVDSDGTAATDDEGTSVHFTLSDFSTGNNIKGIFNMHFDNSTSYYKFKLGNNQAGTWQVSLVATKKGYETTNTKFYFKVKSETCSPPCGIGSTCIDGTCQPLVLPGNQTNTILTCTDGIQNQNEEGVDCGGSCPPCPEEQPLTETCNGCVTDSTCLPFGTRILNGDAKYCGIAQDWEVQQEKDAACQNNYECKSNQCSNGACIDIQEQLKETQGMLQKVLAWFNRIFGSDKT